MEDLDAIKAFAGLEGSRIHLEMEDKPDAYWYSEDLGSEYDPLIPSELNCIARDKYELDINHYTQLDCGPDGSGSYDFPYAVVSKGKVNVSTPLNNASSEAICRAVIECILKSQGLWK